MELLLVFFIQFLLEQLVQLVQLVQLELVFALLVMMMHYLN
jgi:hypothetical protein